MTEASAAWLSDAAYALLADAGRDRQRLTEAGRLGARAAAASLGLPMLTQTFLTAAVKVADEDATAPAMPMMRLVKRLTMAAIDGYQKQAYAQLSHHDRDREQFVADLLTGRSDPGRLAARR